MSVSLKQQLNQYEGLPSIALKTLLPTMLINYYAQRCWQIDKLLYLSFAIGFLLLWCGVSWFFWGRYRELKTEQFLIFLEYLSGKVSAGQTLEAALISAPDDLEQQLGGNSKTIKGLGTMQRMLSAQIDLEIVLRHTAKLFGSRHSQVFFSVIPFLRHYGGKLEDYVRETHRSLSDEMRLQKVIASEQSAKNSEAMMMILMPFVFAVVMNQQKDSTNSALYTVPTFLYLASTLVAAITLIILSHNLIDKIKFKPYKLSIKQVTNPYLLLLSDILLRHSPLHFHNKIALYLKQVSENKQQVWPRYVRKKISFFALGLVLALPGLILPAKPQWQCLALPILFTLLQDMEIIRLYRQQQLCYNLSYPTLLALLSNLLHSGLTLTKSLSLIFESFDYTQYPVLRQDLNLLRQKIESGITARNALLALSEKISRTEIVSSLHLMARYDRDGGNELLEILNLQTTTSRDLYKDSMRKRLQQRGLLLLLPMSLDLAIVMITAILPALSAFHSAF